MTIRPRSLAQKIPAYQPVATDAPEPGPSGCLVHPNRGDERAACAKSFEHFLPHWKFVNRETGDVHTFADLWPGQQRAVDEMVVHPWLLMLKAGKLGFTELECAFDGWVALFRQSNARVHLFSKDGKAAKELLGYVRFGVAGLPDWLGLPFGSGPGADTTTEFRLRGGNEDTRLVRTFSADPDVAIDQTATHSHVDELARMPWPDDLWSGVESTIAPGGTVHILSRGAGDGDKLSELWALAEGDGSPLHRHFEAWDGRPRIPTRDVREGEDPSAAFYAEKEAGMTAHQLRWFLPMTPEEALSGDDEEAFVALAQWLGCYDETLPPLAPGNTSPLIIGCDAGVTNDYFAIVAVSRHPADPLRLAVRQVRIWTPPKGGEINFNEVENFLRVLCLGGCTNGHPNKTVMEKSAEPGCEACAADQRFPAHNVVQIAYDAYQLVGMMQRLARDRVAWCLAFNQGGDRLEADGNLRQMIVTRTISHGNEEALDDAVRAANAKVSKDEDSRLRIIKRNPKSKIDALVALSMAAKRALDLSLPNRGDAA